MLKNLPQMHFKLFQKAAGNLIGNKYADKTVKVSRHLPQNESGTVESETENTGFDREIPNERDMYP